MKFQVYSRTGCGLCEEMVAALSMLPATAQVPIEVLDVDADAQTQRRYGHKVPVLLLAGDLVCHGHLDELEVHKALALHRRPV